MYDDQNIFAKILRGEIPCAKVAEGDHYLAFRDINPQAEVHVLVIPKGAYVSLVDFATQASAAEIQNFWQGVEATAQAVGVVDSGFRIAANHGADANQEVPHFHVHILGGQNLKGLLSA